MLLNSGVFSYNGVSFLSLYKSKVEVKPVKDSAGRALVARAYMLDVEGRIAGVGSTDATLAAMRIALEKPAGALVYTGKGFGPLNVNVPGGVYDAAYGPWPEVLSWEPIGNNQGCLVRWKCMTELPCEENPVMQGVIEYVWSESWDIDEEGYTTRTIEGHVTIQATRAEVDSRAIPDNADAYRERVVPELPAAFQRTQNYKLSEDKRTLEFHVKDEELPQPLPDGVATASVRHKVTWRRPGKGAPANASHTISGTLTLPARTPKGYVLEKIMLILRARWGNMAGAIAGQRNGLTYFLDNIELDDEVFGRSTSFSATVHVLGAIWPSWLLETSGLWQALPNTDFLRWKQSIFGASGRAQGPRGVAGMAFQNGDDAIVDLCARGGALLRANAGAGGKSLVGRSSIPRQLNGVALNPANTWLQYRLRLRLLESDRIARHKPLGAAKLETAEATEDMTAATLSTSANFVPPPASALAANAGTLLNNTLAQGIGVLSAGSTGGAAELEQQVSSPSYTLLLEGGAVRIGYPIPMPRLASVNNQKVVQLRQDGAQEQISAVGGVPVYASQWRIWYSLPQAESGEMPMPLNAAFVD